jgi:quercetin dioxygenase-like cupin family protein
MRPYHAAALLALLAASAPARDTPAPPHAAGGARLFPPAEVRWHEGPPSLPRGALMAVLEGDPGKPGPFVFRLKLPAGYRVPPHTHPRPERVTVLAGTFHLGMGDRFDEASAWAMPAGSYGTWPAGMRHYVWAEGETVLQFHGEGPWEIVYVNPADDPRNRK